MIKIDELRQRETEIKNEIKALKSENKIEDAHAKLADLKAVQQEIEIELAIAENVKDMNESEVLMNATISKNDQEIVRLMVNKMANISLTDKEEAILDKYKDKAIKGQPRNITGQEFILPESISTLIEERMRELGSIRNILGTKKVGTLKGSWTYDATPDAELVDVVDGVDMEDSDNLKFERVSFELQKKGALIPISQTLLAFTDNDMVRFIANVFAKRAVNTYNKMAVAELKAGKTAKALTSIKGLVKSARVDLDLAQAVNSVVITNQVGFNALAEEEDLRGISYIQPALSSKASLYVNGMLVHVLPEKSLPTINKGTNEAPNLHAPIFYGNMDENFFVDAGKYEFSTDSSAGFTKNVLYTKVIDYVDFVVSDKSDEAYIYGELKIK